MHRFAEVFEDHAILKGGLALRLLDSPRATTDIDYVFVPFDSKKEVREQIEAVLAELEGASVAVTLNSRLLRAEIRIDAAAILIEVNVARTCRATPMATGSLARAHGQPSRIVRVMSPDIAFAHKLAAWNERRLPRDLYDCYFFAGRLREMPDRETLEGRLAKIESKLPALKKLRSMTVQEFAQTLQDELDALDQAQVEGHLAALLPPDELPGLAQRMRGGIARVCEALRA